MSHMLMVTAMMVSLKYLVVVVCLSEGAQVDALFEQNSSIIKRDVNEEQGQKYIRNLHKLGIKARIEAAGQSTQSADPGIEASEEMIEASAQDADIDGQPLSPSETEEQKTPCNYPFVFTGSKSEYFRIWIVNLFLTIITLGIYSAWAKVRNTQYLYGHTSVAGSSFAYLATPLSILKGRLIAVAVFVVFSVIQDFMPVVGLVLIPVFIAAIPWIITRALSFQLRMTGWRNLRFGFDGKTGGAAMAFIVWPLVGILSMGIMLPYAIYKQTEYVLGNVRLGTSKVDFQPCVKAFVMVFFIAVGLVIAAAILSGIAGMIHPAIGFIIVMSAYLFAFIYIHVRIGNLKLNQCSMHDGDISLTSSMKEGSFAKVFIINNLLIVLTLGLYAPCATVAFIQYRMDHLLGQSKTDLDHFVAAEEQKVSALGEELGEVFDMDIAI